MKKLIFFISLSMLILVGCEKRYERTIWVNPDVECCGVKDPLNNLEWLNNWYEDSYFNREIDYPTYEIIYLFCNNNTFDNFIVTKTFGTNYDNYFQLFTCDGEWIDEGRYLNYNSDYSNPDVLYQETQINVSKYTSIPECQLCDDFFENHTLVDTIAYFYVKQIKK